MENKAKGCLFVVGTPIGNLGDLTFRALETLKSVDLVAAENTMRTRKLFSHYDVHTPLTSFHEHTKKEKLFFLLEKMNSGTSIALVTDAGTPCVSDPGSWLIYNASLQGISITPIPGVSALTTAVSVSLIRCDQFTFIGFLPPKRKKKEEAILAAGKEKRPFIFFESPHRIKNTIADLARLLPGHLVCIARELTKIHEEVVTDLSVNILKLLENRTLKGEFTVTVGLPPRNYKDKTSGEPSSLE